VREDQRVGSLSCVGRSPQQRVPGAKARDTSHATVHAGSSIEEREPNR